MAAQSPSADPFSRPPGPAAGRSLLRQAARYPELYTWYVFVSSLDILFTWLILQHGGRELNQLADWIIDRHDVPGLTVFKFATVVLVVLICETVGRFRHETGAKLARWAVAISAFPAVVGAVHLVRIARGVMGIASGTM